MFRRFAAEIALCALIAGLSLASAAETPPQPVPAPAAAPAPNQYLIGPGDMLQVFVWNHPELTVSVPVRPDGQISTPLVENMPAAGRTASQLSRDLEVRLQEYVRSPTVNVIVTTAMSTFSQVKIVGQVMKPQAIPYREGVTVMDLVLAAGGLNQFASGNRAKLVRMVGGKQTEIRVRLDRLMNKGDMKQNLSLLPGDVLVVPQTLF
jgi:polysaccharide export outer membrane protein